MGRPSEYTQEQKFEAALHYYQFHNFAKLERELNIPVTTVRSWTEQEWWQDLTKQIVKEFDADMRAKGLAIIQKAQAEIMDRLENGDAVLTKTGQIIRKPAALRDVLFTFLTSFDKNRIINMQPTSVPAGTASLESLQKQLKEIGQAVKGKVSEDIREEKPAEPELPRAEGA